MKSLQPRKATGFDLYKGSAMTRVEGTGTREGVIYDLSSRGTENVNTGLYSLRGGCELSLLWRDTAWGGGDKELHMCASIIHTHTQTQPSPNSSACEINLNSTRVSNWSPVSGFWFRRERRRASGGSIKEENIRRREGGTG